MYDELIRIALSFLSGIAGTGALLRYYFENKLDARIKSAVHKENLLVQEQIEFKKQQLREFYGPIYASLKLNAVIYPIWLAGNLKEINKNIISLFISQNEEIVDILKTRAHLIDGEEYPPSFARYMASVTVWNMYCAREKEPWLPPNVEKIEEIKWPNDFEQYIISKTETLKAEYDHLLLKYKV